VLAWIEIIALPLTFFWLVRRLCRGMYDYPASIYGWRRRDIERGSHSY
jgi:hypothetical protein